MANRNASRPSVGLPLFNRSQPFTRYARTQFGLIESARSTYSKPLSQSPAIATAKAW